MDVNKGENQKVRRKSLSPKLHLKRISIMIPEEIYFWIKEKSVKERKSMSLLIAEILDRTKNEEQS